MDIFSIIGFIFLLSIILPLLNYILRSLFFIKPMTERYKIMAKDLSNDINGRYKYIFICIIVISYILYNLRHSLIILFSTFSILLIYGIYLYKKYSKYTILNFINEFSADLFDWHKIYASYLIDEDTKRKCFLIHNLDYDDFHEQHLSYLKHEVERINYEIEKCIRKNLKLENSNLSVVELINYFEKINYTFEYSKFKKINLEILTNGSYTITKYVDSIFNDITFQNKLLINNSYFIKISNEDNTSQKQTEKNQKYAYFDFLKEHQITEQQLVELINYCYSINYTSK